MKHLKEFESHDEYSSLKSSLIKPWVVYDLDHIHYPKEYEYVDLGLPSGTLWANMNVGASTAEDYGDYFAWGETTGYNSGKTIFNWSTYSLCNGSYTTMTKYCTSSSYGTVDKKTELEFNDDAAYVNWSSDWCIPSDNLFKELINSSYTTTIWTTKNNIYGRLITSKTNGNSIFLPAAGRRSNGSLFNAGSRGHYWSRSLYSTQPYNAYIFEFYSTYIGTDYANRLGGLPIRPVRKS